MSWTWKLYLFVIVCYYVVDMMETRSSRCPGFLNGLNHPLAPQQLAGIITQIVFVCLLRWHTGHNGKEELEQVLKLKHFWFTMRLMKRFACVAYNNLNSSGNWMRLIIQQFIFKEVNCQRCLFQSAVSSPNFFQTYWDFGTKN